MISTMPSEVCHLFRTGDSRSRLMLIAVMLGGALFGFLAAGVVGWLIFGPSPKFALCGAFIGLLLVAIEPCSECLKPHLTVNLRRSFWSGYLLAVWKLTIGIIPIMLLGSVFAVVIPMIVAVLASTTDLLALATDLTLFWAVLSLKVIAGVLLTSAASLALLVTYTALKRRFRASSATR